MTSALLRTEPAVPAFVPLAGEHESAAAAVARSRREDRERIARDLHDHVLQRLFAAGLATQRVANGLEEGDYAAMLHHAVSELDDAVRDSRGTVSELCGPRGPEPTSVRERLTAVVSATAPLLGFTPSLRLAGPLDGLADRIVFDLVAVLREGLFNSARYAGAQQVKIDVIALSDRVVARVRDDGVGLGDTRRRSGLANLRERAEKHSGTFDLGPAFDDGGDQLGTGTSLIWSVPVR
jgi:signal transduction histidine kinase